MNVLNALAESGTVKSPGFLRYPPIECPTKPDAVDRSDPTISNRVTTLLLLASRVVRYYRLFTDRLKICEE